MFGSDELHIRSPIIIIAAAFNVQPKDIRHALRKGDAIPKEFGEHRALEYDTEERRVEWVKKNVENRTAVNRTEFYIIVAKLSAQWLRKDGLSLF
jgi:surface antigen